MRIADLKSATYFMPTGGTNSNSRSRRYHGIALACHGMCAVACVALYCCSRAERNSTCAKERSMPGVEAKESAGPDIMEIVAEAPLGEEARDCVRLFATGNVQATLQWCACPSGSHFMAAKRAGIVKKVVSAADSPLVIDAGEAFSGEDELDRLRARTHLRIMELVKYDFGLLGEDCWRLGADFVRDTILKSPVQWLCANVCARENRQPVSSGRVVVERNGKKVAVIGLTSREYFSEKLLEANALCFIDPLESYEKLRPEGVENLFSGNEVTIVIGALSKSDIERLASSARPPDAIVSSGKAPRDLLGVIAGEWQQQGQARYREEWPNWRLRVGNTFVYYTEIAGAAGVMEFGLSSVDNVSPRQFTRQIRTTGFSPDDPEVLALVEEFFDTARGVGIADTSKYRRGQWDGMIEQGATFVGAKKCMECHKEQYQKWMSTAHARAYGALTSRDRWFYPDCVSCHTTGFGYRSGFVLSERPLTPLAMWQEMSRTPTDAAKNAEAVPSFPIGLEAVQCEACHGPRSRHVAEPPKTKGLAARRPDADTCIRCHDPRNSPLFADSQAAYFERIRKACKAAPVGLENE